MIACRKMWRRNAIVMRQPEVCHGPRFYTTGGTVNRTMTRVPCSGAVSNNRFAPSTRARARMPSRPKWPAGREPDRSRRRCRQSIALAGHRCCQAAPQLRTLGHVSRRCAAIPGRSAAARCCTEAGSLAHRHIASSKRHRQPVIGAELFHEPLQGADEAAVVDFDGRATPRISRGPWRCFPAGVAGRLA